MTRFKVQTDVDISESECYTVCLGFRLSANTVDIKKNLHFYPEIVYRMGPSRSIPLKLLWHLFAIQGWFSATSTKEMNELQSYWMCNRPGYVEQIRFEGNQTSAGSSSHVQERLYNHEKFVNHPFSVDFVDITPC